VKIWQTGATIFGQKILLYFLVKALQLDQSWFPFSFLLDDPVHVGKVNSREVF